MDVHPAIRARLAAALAASVALHLAALGGLSQLPRGWLAGSWSLDLAGTGGLHARLRHGGPAIEPSEPEARALIAPPPEAPSGGERLPATRGTGARDAGDPVAGPPPAERGGAGVLTVPVYYPANELDQRPLILAHVEPAFPRGAPVESGRVVLQLFVGTDGAVEKVAVVAAEPSGAFEGPAVEAFAAARFTPGIKDRVPVRSLVTVEVLFGPPDAPTQAPRSEPPTPAPVLGAARIRSIRGRPPSR